MATKPDTNVKEKILKRRRSLLMDANDKAHVDPNITGFILNTGYFEKWNEQLRNALMGILNVTSFTVGKYIQKQGAPFEDIYFLIEGTAMCIANPYNHRSEYPGFYKPLPLNAKEQAIFSAMDYDRFQCMPIPSLKYVGKRMTVKQCHRLHHMSKLAALKRIKGYSAAEGYQSNKRQEISIVGQGEMIGDVEVILSLPLTVFSFLCTSDCKLLSLNIPAFDRTFRKNERTMELIRMTTEVKLLQRLRSAPGFQCPLIASLIQQLAAMAPGKKMVTTKRNLIIGKKREESEKMHINRVVLEMTPGYWKRAADMTASQKEELDEVIQRIARDTSRHYKTLKKTKVIKLDDKRWS